MSDHRLTIFLSAAEASGDHHAARLIGALRRRVPDARILGAAGPQMAAQGCEVLADLTARASMVGGPLLHLGYYQRMVARLSRAMRSIRPDIHVPVDSPALNWHLAKAARRCGAKVVYYVAPQVWAWAPWRVGKLRRLTDAVACILPFEQEYLRSRGISASYVGHPLFDDLPPLALQLPDIGRAWADGTWQVALVPGSRPGEIRGHAPALLDVARSIRRRWPASTCFFAAGDWRGAGMIAKACGVDLPEASQAGGEGLFEVEEGIKVAVGQTRQVLAQSHFGVVKSGTVTLEAAYFGLPMVIFYRTGLVMAGLHATLGRCRSLVPTRHLSLVNILAGQRMVTELMPWLGRMRSLKRAVHETMSDLGRLCELRQSLLELAASLRTAPVAVGIGDPGTAADRTAELILRTLDRQR